MKEEQKDIRIAVLIDSENISAKYADIIFDEIEKYGQATYRRIYGDWSKGSGWEKVLLEKAISPMQQFRYTQGKNSTDSAMIIDAMDILYSENVEGFCLVTSDSDFTRLAMRLREAGKLVIGMGESKTPKSIREACNRFVTLDFISNSDNEDNEKKGSQGKNNFSPTDIITIEDTLIDIVTENSNKGKQTRLGEAGSRLNNKFPDFDVRNYGYTKFSTFLSERCKNIELNKDIMTIKDASASKDQIERAIRKVIADNENIVRNLAVINEEIRKLYPNFTVKDYGYSKMSSFLRSFKCFKVMNNEVALRDKK